MCKFIVEKKELKGGLKEALNIFKCRVGKQVEREREKEKLYTSTVKRNFINNIDILHSIAIQNNISDVAEEQEYIGYTEKIYHLSETEYLQWEDEGYNFQYVNEDFKADINELSDMYLFELLMKAVKQLEVLR